MQIKNTIQYYHEPTRMVIITNTEKNVLVKMLRKWNSHTLLVGVFLHGYSHFGGHPWWFSGKESICQCRRCEFNPQDWEDPLEKEMATHSSFLAWEIPWTEETGGLVPGDCKELDTT